MSWVDGKEFVIKDVFADVMNMEENKKYHGKAKYHFGIPWKMTYMRYEDKIILYLKCLKSPGSWSIKAEIKMKLINIGIEDSPMTNYLFASKNTERLIDFIEFKYLRNHMADGKLPVEMYVKIKKVTGIQEICGKLRSFDDETAKRFSDVVLIVDNEKFYVGKMYLASHSSYFESLLMGNFAESKQSEITLNDVDMFDFQKFLEVLHGEPAVNDETVEGILRLADMYDSQTAMRQCEKFLMENSKQSLKDKFNAALKYKMNNLKEKCMAEIKTKEDIISVFPQDVYQMDQLTWAELLLKSLKIY